MEISQALYDTLQEMEHIEEVHFTAKGAHYFNKHELTEKKKPTGKFYGRLNYKQEKSGTQGDKTLYRVVEAAVPDALITKSMSRDQVIKQFEKEESAREKALELKREKREKLADVLTDNFVAMELAAHNTSRGKVKTEAKAEAEEAK